MRALHGCRMHACLPPGTRPRPPAPPRPQVCASLEAGTAEPLAGAWPGAASLSIARASEATVPGLVSTPAHEEAFLVALQQQIARVSRQWAGGARWYGRGSRRRMVINACVRARVLAARSVASSRAAWAARSRLRARVGSYVKPCLGPAAAPQVAAFTEALSASLRESLQALCADAPRLARAAPAELKAEARRLGDEVLELERFIQLNQVRDLI